MNPIGRLTAIATGVLEGLYGILQADDPLAEPPKTGPALLLSGCSLGADEWKPSVHDDQGEALEPKAPRIVNRLAADEHDAQWISDYGTHWKWDNDRWWHTEPGGGKGIWVATPYGFIPDSSGPFTEATAQSLTSADKLSPDELAEAAECILYRASIEYAQDDRAHLERLHRRFVQAADIAADAGPLLW